MKCAHKIYNEWSFNQYALTGLKNPSLLINLTTVWLGGRGKGIAFYSPLIIAKRFKH